MAKFVIQGSGDDARALLKTNLDAQDAKFNASLDAFFRPAPAEVAPAAPATPVAPVAAPAVKPAAAVPTVSAWALGQMRNYRVRR